MCGFERQPLCDWVRKKTELKKSNITFRHSVVVIFCATKMTSQLPMCLIMCTQTINTCSLTCLLLDSLIRVTHITPIGLVGNYDFRVINTKPDLHSNFCVLKMFLWRKCFKELTILIQETDRLKRKSAIGRWPNSFYRHGNWIVNLTSKIDPWWYCVLRWWFSCMAIMPALIDLHEKKSYFFYSRPCINSNLCIRNQLQNWWYLLLIIYIF